jgi:rubrerythrin
MKEADFNLLVELLKTLAKEHKEVAKKLSHHINEELEKAEGKEVYIAGLTFLKDMMQALIEQRNEDVEKMKKKLEEFLTNGSARDRGQFAWDLWYVMNDWARDLRTLDTLKKVLRELLADKFNEYYEWVKDLEEKADRLSKAVGKLYEQCDC